MLEQELMSLGVLFFFAIVGGVLAVRFKQPAVIGLLLMGAIIGPNMLNFVKDQTIIEMMSELGSILLLFVIGLEFVIPKLVRIGFKAIMIGVLKIGIIFFMIYEMSLVLGIGQQAALIFGVMLSISSTVVIVMILESKGLYQREEMPLLVGVLIIEDIFAVIVLTFLSGAKSGLGLFGVFENLIVALTILLVAYMVMLKISKIIIPLLIKNGGDEVVTFIALGICAGFSYLAYSLGLLPATGAFLAGSIVASLPEVKLFEHAIKPYTLTFSSLFFISIGTMVNFSALLQNLPLLVFMIIGIVISRFIAVGSVSYLFANFKRQQMIFSSMAMISVGEFSLLIAKAAAGLNMGIDFVSISAFLIFITAIIMSFSISYFEKVTDALVTSPIAKGHKPRSFSNFMRSLSEEIDTDNSSSIKFKKLLFECLTNLLFIGFIFILWTKIIGNVEAQITLWFIHILFFLGVFVLLSIIYVKARQMYRILVQIISNIYIFGGSGKSRTLLSNLLLALLLLLVTIFSPVLIVLFKLPAYINIISLALLLIVILRFMRLFSMVHFASSKGSYFPRYKKISEIKFDFSH